METPNEYKLTDGERQAMKALNSQLLNAKLQVFNLNQQLELAKNEVNAAEARWLGALGLLATAQGYANAKLATDLSKLVKE